MNCFGCGSAIVSIKIEFGCAPFCSMCRQYANIDDEEERDALKSKPPRAEGYFGASELEELDLESLSLELMEPEGWTPSWGFDMVSDLGQKLGVSPRPK